MDRTQTIKILAVLKSAYPHAFQNMTKTDGEAMLNLWMAMFTEESYEEVNAAIGALIATRTVGFSPTIGEVKEQLRKLPRLLPRLRQQSLLSLPLPFQLQGPH